MTEKGCKVNITMVKVICTGERTILDTFHAHCLVCRKGLGCNFYIASNANNGCIKSALKYKNA